MSMDTSGDEKVHTSSSERALVSPTTVDESGVGTMQWRVTTYYSHKWKFANMTSIALDSREDAEKLAQYVAKHEDWVARVTVRGSRDGIAGR